MSNKQISNDNQLDTINELAIRGYAVPPPKENVVFNSIKAGATSVAFLTAVDSVSNSLKAKKIQFVKPEELMMNIGIGIGVGVWQGMNTMKRNKQFDSFVEKLEEGKMQFQITQNQK